MIAALTAICVVIVVSLALAAWLALPRRTPANMPPRVASPRLLGLHMADAHWRSRHRIGAR